VSAITLRSLIGDLDPTACKLHCAVYNGIDHPIDVLTRSWDEWVVWSQWRPSRDDFNRQFIFTMARDRTNSTLWLFGGVFEVVGRRDTPHAHSYDLELREDLLGPFIKRLWLRFKPPGRAIRLNFETHLLASEVNARGLMFNRWRRPIAVSDRRRVGACCTAALCPCSSR